MVLSGIKRQNIFLIFVITALCFFSCAEDKKKEGSANLFPLDKLLTKEQVGAEVMPDSIAAVSAPFPMPEFKRPEFPDFSVSISKYGASEDHMNTGSIQQAIDEVGKKGGGKVVVPKGKWRTGRLILKSNVNLHFEPGAELYFSGEIEDFRPAVFTRHGGVEIMSLGACIYAYEEENIAITGSGTLYGPGEGSIRNQEMTENVIEKFVPLEKPVEERVYEGYNGESVLLPSFISPTKCRNVYIEGITLERTAFWNIVPVYCDNVIIRGVTVNSVGIPKGDGIDIVSSRNVLIEYSTLNNGDDCFTMKAGRGEDGIRVDKPTENVVVRYCLAKEGHGGITIGSETAGMVRNIYMHDCVFDNTMVGIRFKSRRPRGGGGENFIYERIRMNLRGTAFKWDMLGQEMYVGELASRFPVREINELTPRFSNVRIRDILVENAETFVKIYGIPESPLKDVTLENIQVNNTRDFFRASDARNISFRNLKVKSDDSLMSLQNIQNLSFENAEFNVRGNDIYAEVKGDSVKNILFKNTRPEHPINWDSNMYKKN